MISWIVTFNDGSTMIVHNKELVVNVCDYVITNSSHNIEYVVAINKVYEA